MWNHDGDRRPRRTVLPGLRRKRCLNLVGKEEEKYLRLAEGRGSRRESISLGGNALNGNEAVSTSTSLQTSPQEWGPGVIGKRVKDKAGSQRA